jgi:hypothetical protein
MNAIDSRTIRRIDPVSPNQAPHAALAVPMTDSDAPIRLELVRQIQAQIAAGIYESEEKLAIACERLLDRLGL